MRHCAGSDLRHDPNDRREAFCIQFRTLTHRNHPSYG
jgi:hypothetical protein